MQKEIKAGVKGVAKETSEKNFSILGRVVWAMSVFHGHRARFASRSAQDRCHSQMIKSSPGLIRNGMDGPTRYQVSSGRCFSHFDDSMSAR